MEKTIKSFRKEVQDLFALDDQEFSSWTGISLKEIYSWDFQEAGVNLSPKALFLVRLWMISGNSLFGELSQNEKKLYISKIFVDYNGNRYSLLSFLRKYAFHEIKDYFSLVESHLKILFQ